MAEWDVLEASSESRYMSILSYSWAISRDWIFKRGCVGAETSGDNFCHGDE